jgi:hypothetical protein
MGKGGALRAQSLAVRGFDNHLGLLDEQQTKDGVDNDIASPCNKKACGVPLAREKRKKTPAHHRQFGGDGVAVMLDNNTQHDGRVVGWAMDGCDGVWIDFWQGRQRNGDCWWLGWRPYPPRNKSRGNSHHPGQNAAVG